MSIIDKISARISKWQLPAEFTGEPFLYVASVVLGVLCGVSAAFLKGGIGMVMHLVFSTLNIKTGNWVFFLLPVIGILIAVAFTRYVIKMPLDHASERIAEDLKEGNTKLKPRLIFGSIIGCSFTLGLGGSAGAESPIAYTGAAIGSNIGRTFKVSSDTLAQLVGCGAAAGIAGIYMAPIGGMMFALEVLRMKQNLQSILAMTLASLASALTSYIMLGCHTDVTFVPEMRFDLARIPFVLLLGVFCGVYSVYYGAMMSRCRKLSNRFNNIWCRALVGGLLLSSMLFIFPSLYGEGYNLISKLMDNDSTAIISYSPLYPLSEHFVILMALFVGLLLIKPLATSATNDSGGIGGEFTPTFFCGAVAGYLFAALCNHYLHLDLPYALFAYFGMAAVMSGGVHAPLMAIFITSEITGMYGFILPLTIAALTSFVTTKAVERYVVKSWLRSPSPKNPVAHTASKSEETNGVG